MNEINELNIGGEEPLCVERLINLLWDLHVDAFDLNHYWIDNATSEIARVSNDIKNLTLQLEKKGYPVDSNVQIKTLNDQLIKLQADIQNICNGHRYFTISATIDELGCDSMEEALQKMCVVVAECLKKTLLTMDYRIDEGFEKDGIFQFRLRLIKNSFSM